MSNTSYTMLPNTERTGKRGKPAVWRPVPWERLANVGDIMTIKGPVSLGYLNNIKNKWAKDTGAPGVYRVAIHKDGFRAWRAE